PQSMEAAEKIEPYTTDEVWARFTYTEEENKVLESTGQDVNKYVEEMRDKFITGDMDLDEDWDEYVETIEKMGGLDEVVDVYQDAYERYQENEMEYFNDVNKEKGDQPSHISFILKQCERRLY